LISLFGIDGNLSEELSRLVDHANVLVDDVETHVTTAVMVTDANVEHTSLVAKSDLAVGVDDVLTQPVVRLIDQRVGLGFVARLKGGEWCSPFATSVRSLIVVIENDAIEDVLQLVEVVRRLLIEELCPSGFWSVTWRSSDKMQLTQIRCRVLIALEG
jgi:hypothetical protein